MWYSLQAVTSFDVRDKQHNASFICTSPDLIRTLQPGRDIGRGGSGGLHPFHARGRSIPIAGWLGVDLNEDGSAQLEVR
jgi:hypothetical protein